MGATWELDTGRNWEPGSPTYLQIVDTGNRGSEENKERSRWCGDDGSGEVPNDYCWEDGGGSIPRCFIVTRDSNAKGARDPGTRPNAFGTLGSTCIVYPWALTTKCVYQHAKTMKLLILVQIDWISNPPPFK